MKRFLLILTLFAIEVYSSCIQGYQIECTDISVETYRSLKTCRMPLCAINSTGVTISSPRDENMTKIIFEYNKRVFRLPENVSKVYPNLEVYSAGSCSIVAIIKKNFEGLTFLNELNLEFNNIERIPSDIFIDLTSLQGIFLASNKIKFISGKPFQGLRKLQTITLENNVCISENWNEEQDMDSFEKTIHEKCNFPERKHSFSSQLETISEV